MQSTTLIESSSIIPIKPVNKSLTKPTNKQASLISSGIRKRFFFNRKILKQFILKTINQN